MIRRLAILAGPLLAILVAWLAPGCADVSSMPTQPTVPDEDSWTVKYAPVALRDLLAVWAMDSDDAWFAGRSGTMLHWDGETITHHETGTNDGLEDLDGCATDEVWGVGNGSVLRWDGRRWTSLPVEYYYRYWAVLCEAPDQVFVGGKISQWPSPSHAVVRRYTGRGWKDYELHEPDTVVRKLWRPHADGPLFAMVKDSVTHAYRLDGGHFELMDWPGLPMDADGDLVMLYDDDNEFPISLHRLEPDHTLTEICERFAGKQVLQSKAILACFDRGAQFVVDCVGQTVLEAVPNQLHDFAVPQRPGPSSPAVFAVGNRARALIGGWQPDWTMSWRQLSPVASYWLQNTMLGNATELFVPASGDDTWGVMVLDHADWHMERLGYTPDGMRFLANGDLLAWTESWGSTNRGEIHRRDARGVWHALPPTGRYQQGVWGSHENDLLAMSSGGDFLQLIDGEWRVRDSLSGHCSWFDATAADRLFAIVDLYRLGGVRILHFDGSIWRDITPGRFSWISGRYLGPHTGTLYIRLFVDDHYLHLRYRDDAWEEFPEAAAANFTPNRFRESLDGHLYCSNGADIYRLHPGGWKPVARSDTGIDDFWVDPDSGVHIADGQDRLLHHPYRPR